MHSGARAHAKCMMENIVFSFDVVSLQLLHVGSCMVLYQFPADLISTKTQILKHLPLLTVWFLVCGSLVGPPPHGAISQIGGAVFIRSTALRQTLTQQGDTNLASQHSAPPQGVTL